MKKVRIDKWLWSVRIFKTRTLATNACKTNKVKIEGKPIKPSYLVQVGERIEVRKEGFDLTFEVVKLLEKRVGAAIAFECYKNHTPEAEMNKFKAWFVGKARNEVREKGEGRPTKRERRDIDRFKGDYLKDGMEDL